MAALEIPGNGDTGQKITEESIQNTLKSLEDPLQRVRPCVTTCVVSFNVGLMWKCCTQNFVSCCLERNKTQRPTARELLFHAVLFEVHSLKLLAAHTLVKKSSACPRPTNLRTQELRVLFLKCFLVPLGGLPESDTYQPTVEPSQVIAEIKHSDGRESQKFTCVSRQHALSSACKCYSAVALLQCRGSLGEDVRQGTVFVGNREVSRRCQVRSTSPYFQYLLWKSVIRKCVCVGTESTHWLRSRPSSNRRRSHRGRRRRRLRRATRNRRRPSRSTSRRDASSASSATCRARVTSPTRCWCVHVTREVWRHDDVCRVCIQMTIHLRMDDSMNRQLTGDVTTKDTGASLADELVHHSLINPVSRTWLTCLCVMTSARILQEDHGEVAKVLQQHLSTAFDEQEKERDPDAVKLTSQTASAPAPVAAPTNSASSTSAPAVPPLAVA